MLRREPTRIEMKPEDIEEFDQYCAQQKKEATSTEDKADPEAPQPKKESTASRIGLASQWPPTTAESSSPEY